MQQHHAATDAFPAEPDYTEAVTGGEVHVPALVVTHDGPLPTVPHPATSWTAGQTQTTSDGSARQIAPANPARRKLRVKNTAAAGGVVISLARSNEECQAGGSSTYPLTGTEYVDFTHRGAVYVCAPSGSTGTLALVAEFEDGR